MWLAKWIRNIIGLRITITHSNHVGSGNLNINLAYAWPIIFWFLITVQNNHCINFGRANMVESAGQCMCFKLKWIAGYPWYGGNFGIITIGNLHYFYAIIAGKHGIISIVFNNYIKINWLVFGRCWERVEFGNLHIVIVVKIFDTKTDNLVNGNISAPRPYNIANTNKTNIIVAGSSRYINFKIVKLARSKWDVFQIWPLACFAVFPHNS